MSTPTTLYTWPDGDTIAVKQGAMDPGYPDELTVLGPVFVPRIYGKDLTAFELGSSGKVVVTLDDLKTMELSNVYNAGQLSSTVIKGVASNAITLDPSDMANTVTAGGLVINDSNNFLALTTPNANGIAIRNALAVTGPASLQATLAVAEHATIGGNASVAGNLTVAGNTNFTGGVDLTGDVSIVGKLTASNDLEVLGRTFMRSNLSVDGPATFSNVVSMESNLSVASNVSVASNLSVGGSATIQSGATINSGLTANGPIALTGPTTVVGDTSITGITSVTGPLSVSGAVALASNLDVASNVTALGSTSLQALSATSPLINGPATVSGPTTLHNTLSVSGATSLADTLAVTGAASFASNVSIAAGRILDVDNIKSVGNTLLLDAAEVVLTDDLNIAGSLNAINRTVLNVEDKRVTLASASNGLVDGAMTNDGAGVQIFGLPANVDPSESSNPVYEKSLAWRHGTSGVTALRTDRDAESFWDLRSGHLRLTSFKTADTAVSYGFRISDRDKLEVVRFVKDGSMLTSKRIARFGGGVPGALLSALFYPPAPLTDYITTLAGLAYGNGLYTVSASSEAAELGPSAFLAFDGSHDTFWHTEFLPVLLYNEDGTYSGTAELVPGYLGEWLQIQLPVAITLSGYEIVPRTGWSDRTPRDFRVYGSNDGQTWTAVDIQMAVSGYADFTAKSFSVSGASAYTTYALVTNTINGAGSLQIAEWKLLA